jgi:hypothetical protein
MGGCVEAFCFHLVRVDRHNVAASAKCPRSRSDLAAGIAVYYIHISFGRRVGDLEPLSLLPETQRMLLSGMFLICSPSQLVSHQNSSHRFGCDLEEY